MLGTWKEEAEAPAVKPIYQQKGLPRLGGKTLLLDWETEVREGCGYGVARPA